MSRDDRVYLQHILDAIARIDGYLADMSREEFLSHEMAQDAIIRQFEIIGEAAKKLSDSARNAQPELPWKAMAGMRDKLIHQYFGVDIPMVFQAAREDLPNVRDKIASLLDALGNSEE